MIQDYYLELRMEENNHLHYTALKILRSQVKHYQKQRHETNTTWTAWLKRCTSNASNSSMRSKKIKNKIKKNGVRHSQDVRSIDFSLQNARGRFWEAATLQIPKGRQKMPFDKWRIARDS